MHTNAPPSSNICTSSRWLQNMKFRNHQLSHITYTEDRIKHRAAFICMQPRLCWVVHWMQGLRPVTVDCAYAANDWRMYWRWNASKAAGLRSLKEAMRGSPNERNRVCECGGGAALLLRRPDFLSVYMVGLKQQQERHVMTNSTSLSLSVSL